MKELYEIQEEMSGWPNRCPKRLRLTFARVETYDHDVRCWHGHWTPEQKLSFDILDNLGYACELWAWEYEKPLIKRECHCDFCYGERIVGATYQFWYNAAVFTPEAEFCEVCACNEEIFRDSLERFFVPQLEPWDIWYDILKENEKTRKLTSHSKKNRKELA